MNKIKSARLAILNALLRGSRLTAYDANVIGNTTSGARRIRQLRETYPILKEPVPGEMYCRYYIDPEWLHEYRQKQKKPLLERFKTFFDDLFDGGMFEGAQS